MNTENANNLHTKKIIFTSSPSVKSPTAFKHDARVEPLESKR